MTDTNIDTELIEVVSGVVRERRQRIAYRNRTIIEMRRHGMTLQASADTLNPPITKMRVSQILTIAKQQGIDLSPYPAEVKQ